MKLMSAVKSPHALMLLCGYGDHGQYRLKYRVREDMATFDKLLPVEARTADYEIHTFKAKNTFVPRTEYEPVLFR